MEADGYKAYKLSAPFVRHMEMPTVLAHLGDLTGASVLDLG